MRTLKRFLLILLLLLLIGGVGVGVFVGTTGQPSPTATAALQPDLQVRVTTDPWLAFQPTNTTPSVGLIFYPGGLVNPQAYAPLARAIAAQGYLVVIPAMPLNLAVFASDKATEVQRAYPAIQRWAIGGHSLGGSMAARYAYQHPDAVQGVVFWAAYPEVSISLADRALAVAVIYGTADGLVSLADIDTSRAHLPPATRYVAIEGGNHAQFGDYGEQRGDLPATISREQQHAQVIEATVSLLREVERKE